MNLILLEPADGRGGDRYVLRGRRAAHLTEVLRAEGGSTVKVGLLEGPLGAAEVVRIDRDEVELACRFEAEAPPRPLLDLVLAIPRPKTLIKILPEVAAFGVDRLILLRTWRVQKPYLEAQILEPEHHLPLLHEGLMQGRSTRAPEVRVEPLFKPFLEDRAAALFSSADVKLVAHPAAAVSMARIEVRPRSRVVLVIGPEGGLIPYEVAAFEALGFVPVQLGPRPLRVETACVAALAQIELLRQF